MADITTDVLFIGTGPAGSATAALLSSYGIENMVVNRYRWLANTPRAHITNQRTMEVLRDLGRDVEDEAYRVATEQELMGENIFCTSLAGEEIGRLKTWARIAVEGRASHVVADLHERLPADLHGADPVQGGLFARHAGAHVD